LSRTLPDPDLPLREGADFAMNSVLGRKALSSVRLAGFPVLLRDLIEAAHRLAMSCSLPEFTDHGLSHICSLLDRICTWTADRASGETQPLCDLLDEDKGESGVLLLAVVFHDMGMLSQRPEDMVTPRSEVLGKANVDIATWVRSTHILRLEGLLRRLFEDLGHEHLFGDSLTQRAIKIAKAHGSWPWQEPFASLPDRDKGLAAALAAADLLDEDSSRCDTITLLKHRQGTLLNIGHWIRHGLTAGRVRVDQGVVNVRLVRPPGTDQCLAPVFAALRNHYRLVMLYVDSLASINDSVLIHVRFEPPSGIPAEESPSLQGWETIEGIGTQQSLLFNVLATFSGMRLALLQDDGLPAEATAQLQGLHREPVDVAVLQRVAGRTEKRSDVERAFYALLGGEA